MVNIHKIKQEICEIGDRIYKKGFASANDGNISYRYTEKEVVCTPTMISKGFMKPEDLCVVDMEGNQIGGRRKRTSEIMLHLAIMKERPEIKSVVHCHPPHATAFGIAREPIPQCVLPEVEIFLGGRSDHAVRDPRVARNSPIPSFLSFTRRTSSCWPITAP